MTDRKYLGNNTNSSNYLYNQLHYWKKKLTSTNKH